MSIEFNNNHKPVAISHLFNKIVTPAERERKKPLFPCCDLQKLIPFELILQDWSDRFSTALLLLQLCLGSLGPLLRLSQTNI